MKHRIISFILALLSVSLFADVEVVVTASRIPENAKTTPAYVRVIPAKDIKAGETILDVLQTIPDISVKETSPGKPYISMGGFGDNGFGRTLILVNGRPVNRPDMASFDWSSILVANVKKIEIVKGSMSSQYGDQAVAGVINIITKAPEGTHITLAASGASTTSNTQTVFASLEGKTDGISVGLNRDDINPARNRSDTTDVNATLEAYYNFPGLKTTLGASYSDSSYQLPGGLTEDQYNEDPDQAVNLDDSGETTRYGINGSASFSLGPLEFSLPLSYSEVDTSADMTSWYSFTDSYLKTTTASIQTHSSFYSGDSVEITPIGGIDLKQYHLTVDKYSSADRSVQTSEADMTRTDSAFWARTKVNYLDMLIIDGGIRYCHSYLDTTPDVTHNEFVYDAGAVYLFSSQLRISLRYGKVFRYPFLDEQVSYYFGPLTVNTNLKPETGNSYTASIDYTKNSFSLSLAPYIINMDDEIVYNSSTYENENIGSTNHYGFSMKTGYTYSMVHISAGYAFDHAEFADTGKIVPLVPQHTVYGSVRITPVKDVSISTDGRYSSEFYQGTDTDNTQPTIGGRFDWNIRADWNITKALSVYLLAQNLLDDRTPTLAYWSSYSGTSSLYPMPGRTFEAGMKWVY